MANVLPKDALSTVRGFYRARFLLVGSLVAIACGVLALLALMPVYATVSAERLAESDPLSQVSLPPSSDRDDIARAQVLVKELLPVASSTVSALHVLEGILSARPAGVKLSNVRYMRGEEGTIVVSGTAPSRDKINAYRAALGSDSRFKSVSVPIGTLTGSEGGRFDITLSGAF